MAMATVRCGAYNVRVNLSDLSDPADRKKLELNAISAGGEIVHGDSAHDAGDLASGLSR